MPGYSGTPLPKKLGLKDDQRVALINLPAEVRSVLRGELARCHIVKTTAAPSLAPAGMLRICWPKKTSGVATNVTEDAVRSTGLHDIKVCAVTEIWSGLKFVIPVKQRNH